MSTRKRHWLMKSEPDAFSIDDLQRVEALQHEAWDVPLDAVCSEVATHLAEHIA